MSKLKAYADNKINEITELLLGLGRVENIVGKAKKTGYKHFFLFPACFQKAFFFFSLRVIKTPWLSGIGLKDEFENALTVNEKQNTETTPRMCLGIIRADLGFSTAHKAISLIVEVPFHLEWLLLNQLHPFTSWSQVFITKKIILKTLLKKRNGNQLFPFPT